MAIERVLVVVGPGRTDRVDRLVATTADLAGPMSATVSVARLSTDAEYGDARTPPAGRGTTTGGRGDGRPSRRWCHTSGTRVSRRRRRTPGAGGVATS